MTPFDIAIVLGGWIFFLASPMLRTIRTGIVLGTLSAVFASAALVGQPGASIIRIVVVWAYLLVFWRYQFWLAGLSRSDEAVDTRLRRALHGVTAAHRRWAASRRRADVAAQHMARMAIVEACVAAVAALDGVAPPDDAWRETLRLFRDYFIALDDAATPVGLEVAASIDANRDDALVALNKQANAAWQRALLRRDKRLSRSS